MFVCVCPICLQPYQDQIQMLQDAFKNPPQTREEGLYFDDKQYKCVRADKNSIYAKCVSVIFCKHLRIYYIIYPLGKFSINEKV